MIEISSFLSTDTNAGTIGTHSHQNESQHHCLIVIPTYNEVLNIERLISEILTLSPQFDVLVVDDNSPDGTGDRVAALATKTPRVQLLRRAGKLGLGTAYLAGFKEALKQGFPYICEMDADFSHQPRYLLSLLAVAEHEADVAIGSRNILGGGVENWSPMRQFISKGGSFYARTILNLGIQDCTGGFKCFRAQVLQSIDFAMIHSNGYAFQIEMSYRAQEKGFRFKEIPIIFPDRVAGRSKMSKTIVFEAAWRVLNMRLQTGAYKPAAQASLSLPH